MEKVIIIPNCLHVDDVSSEIRLIENICEAGTGTDEYGEVVKAYECSLSGLEFEIKNGFGSDRWVKIIETGAYSIQLMQEANELLSKLPLGSKVIISAQEEFAYFVKTENGYIFKIGKVFGQMKDLLKIADVLNNYICHENIELLDIRIDSTAPNDFLFDIYGYAVKMELAALDRYFTTYAVNGVLQLPTDNLHPPFTLAMLDKEYNMVSFDSITKGKREFIFHGTSDEDDKVSLYYDDLPPKGVAYLMEYLYQNQ